MKKAVILTKVLFPAFLFVYTLSCFSQPVSPKWKYALGATSGTVSSMMTDSVGNVYVVGIFHRDEFKYETRVVSGISALEEYNVFILKTEPTGKPVYLYSIKSLNPGGDIKPGKANINEKGELALVFNTEGVSNFQVGRYTGTSKVDQTNAYLIKFTKTGIINWVHSLENNADTLPETEINDLFLTEEGSVVFTGYFRGPSLRIKDKSIPGTDNDAMLFVGRIDPSGDLPWLEYCRYNTYLDNGEIWGTHLCRTSADFFFLAGYHENYRTFYFGSDSIYNAWSTDAFLARYNLDGNALWVRSFRGDSLDFIEKISVTRANDVVALGMSNSSSLFFDGQTYNSLNGNYDLFIAKYSADGDYLNSTHIATQMNYRKDYEDNAYMNVNGTGNIMICSEFQGNEVFTNEFKLVNAQTGTRDLMIARLDGNTLAPVWTNQGTAPDNNYFDDVFFDNQGNIFIGGTTYNMLDVEGQLIEGDSKDGTPYLAKIRPNGSVDYTYWQLNATDRHVQIAEIASDNYGNSYVAGTFSGVSPVLDDQPLVGPETTGFFLAKYSRVKNIAGNVIDVEGNVVNQGYAKIYGKTYYQRSPVVDSVELSSDGEFVFEDVPFGEFILSIIPLYPTEQGMVTTYFPQAEYWELAEMIKVDANSDDHFYTIQMIPAPVFEGRTELTGGVTQLDSTDLFKTSAKGRPKQRAQVVLVGNKSHKSTWEIVAVIETDEQGNFSFEGVEDGSYLLYVDFPGLPVEDAYAIEISGHQYVSSLDYLVDEEKVSAHGLPIYSILTDMPENPDFSIFPNPATDFIEIHYKSNTKLIIDLYDAQGKHVVHINSESPARLKLTGQVPGAYFLRVMTENEIYFEKIILK